MLGLFQKSRMRSSPIHLYRAVFGIGDSGKVLVTDDETDVVYKGETFQRSTIRHGEIHASGSLDNSALEIYTPHTHPMSDIFRQYPPDQVVTLEILRGERGDPDKEFISVWAGRILSWGVQDFEAKFTCEPSGTAVKRPGLRRNYQYGCPHVLYGPMCRATKSARTTTVSAIAGSEVTLAAGWHGALDKTKFLNGMLEWVTPTGRVAKTILRVDPDGRRVLLAGSTTSLPVGSSVDAHPGCNHQMSDCGDLHANLPNYGGCPWIPTKNPIGAYNSFY